MAVPRTERRFLFVVFPDSDTMIRIFQIKFNKYFKSVETVYCLFDQWKKMTIFRRYFFQFMIIDTKS